MAKQVEGVYDRVMQRAKEEFLNKGFIDASLRDIAKNADTSTGSIYTRFHDKEGLFEILVDNTVRQMKQLFYQIQERFHTLDEEVQKETMPKYTSEGVEQILDFMYQHFDEFQLLLDASYGTKYQSFVEELVQIEVEYTYKYMDTIGCETVKDGSVTEDFLHIIISGYFNAMFEVIRHGMSKEEAVHYMKILERYHMAGFDTVFYPEKY